MQSVACGAGESDKLERLCRYMARGPVSNERLSIDGDGLVVHELKRPFRDGTTMTHGGRRLGAGRKPGTLHRQAPVHIQDT